MSDHYAVIGHPIQHSLSPLIHRQFAEQTEQDIEYKTIEAPLDDFKATVRQFIDAGGRGFNITLPFKQQAYRLADHASQRARLANAANTIVVEKDGQLYADNTDGGGFITDLHKHGCRLANNRLLIIGAGGAVYGLLAALHEQKPRSISIANRTHSKAYALAQKYPDYNIEVFVLPDGIEHSRWSAIINATSASLSQKLPELPNDIEISGWAYDLVYARHATPFMRWAKNTVPQMF